MTYLGRRMDGNAKVFRADAQTIDRLPSCLDLVNHSPTGFEWNYGGSGPAQLALALLVDATGDRAWALQHYQAYKWDVVAKLPEGGWDLPQEEVLEWVAAALEVAR